MYTDVSQVGVALFSSFKNIFNHFALPDFPFILILYYRKVFNNRNYFQEKNICNNWDFNPGSFAFDESLLPLHHPAVDTWTN